MRIVLKFGSGVLANVEGASLDEPQFVRIASEVAEVLTAGHECLIVSSGAVAAGLGQLGLKERPDELSARQACAAVGQLKLMQMYAEKFAGHGLSVAQLLLTHSDLDSRMRRQNARNTLDRLFERRSVVPIINENDSVAVEELRVGDNDRLSAEVAIFTEADVLILLTSVDGLLDEKGATVSEVKDIEAVAALVRDDKGRLSVGGMSSKLQAVKAAVEAGIPTWIASGRKPAQITAIASGKAAGTRFPIREGSRAAARKTLFAT
ncbi:MAG TPA: glutamate 5-kinase [Chthoniobacteraceae bacterium]|jgi:glutamate 5-kinase